MKQISFKARITKKLFIFTLCIISTYNYTVANDHERKNNIECSTGSNIKHPTTHYFKSIPLNFIATSSILTTLYIFHTILKIKHNKNNENKKSFSCKNFLNTVIKIWPFKNKKIDLEKKKMLGFDQASFNFKAMHKNKIY